MTRQRASLPWHLVVLGALALGLAILAALEIGPPSSTARSSREVLTAENGVIQSTVSGSGNLEAGTDTTDVVRVAGRLMARRGQGKLAFIDLVDGSGKIQLAPRRRTAPIRCSFRHTPTRCRVGVGGSVVSNVSHRMRLPL